MDIIQGKVKDIVFKHDASRIVQTVVKYGDEKTRNEVAVELKGSYKELARNKYSKVCKRLFVLQMVFYWSVCYSFWLQS
jgi:pumilio homology domain family member 6